MSIQPLLIQGNDKEAERLKEGRHFEMDIRFLYTTTARLLQLAYLCFF